jgi:hypothetical protein
MPRKFVFNEFKLTGVDRSVFRIVLGQKDNRLIPLVRNAEFKEHICVASGNVGDQEGCLGNLLGDLLQQLLVSTLLSPRSTRILYFSSRYRRR